MFNHSMVSRLVAPQFSMILRGTFRFDKRGIRRPVFVAARSVLCRQGAYLRGIAKRSIRYRRNPDRASAPGTAPYTHGDKLLKKSIHFAVAQDATNVLIGPAANWIGDLGRLHEFGGQRRVNIPAPGFKKKPYRVGEIGPVSTDRYRSAGTGREKQFDPLTGAKVAFIRLRSPTQAAHATRLARRIAIRFSQYRLANYPARPFMRPSLAQARGRLPSFWHNAIHK